VAVKLKVFLKCIFHFPSANPQQIPMPAALLCCSEGTTVYISAFSIQLDITVKQQTSSESSVLQQQEI
jgi:hypothetical protein